MCLKYRLLYILLLFLTGSLFAHAQENIVQSDPLLVTDSVPAIVADPLAVLPLDSAGVAPADTVRSGGSVLDAPVHYEATDSIVMTAGNWAYLYGDADVKYQTIELQSEYIQMNMDSSLVFAKFGLDSAGTEFGYPLFIDGGEQYESKTMRYNFKTKRGYITDVITQQGEGYVTSRQTKKMEDDILYMIDGKYTTCDHHEHPHFYIHMTKAKVRPKKNIVTGPVYLVIEDVPLPLGLPFAFFPFSDTYSSGIIFPSFGDESVRGFFIRDGGYYFAINDYVDLALRGDIYTKGSWGVSAQSSYRKRYRFSGNFNSKYVVTKTGDKGLPDESVSKDFMLTWTHSQDPKANPYRTLSANVNFRTSSYNRNEMNELFNNNSTSNSTSSSVSLTQRFPTLPLTLTASMNVSQTQRDSSLSMTLPDFTATVSRIYPFKRKQRMGKEQWYEKISFNYTGVLRNTITTKQDQFLKANIVKDWDNAIKHTIPVNATFNVFNYINISPNFNYEERWYTSKIEQEYDIQRNALVPRDTTYGFYRVYNYSASVAASTTIYGFFEPLPFIPYVGKKVKMIRHRFEPSVSFSMTPDFGSQRYGYYNTVEVVRNSGINDTIVYSPYSHNLYGVPGRGKSGSITFSIANNLEAKIVSDRDSTGERKISLIDNLDLSMNYNLVADSFKWSDLTARLRLKLTKSYTLNMNFVFDPYTYDYDRNRGVPVKKDVMRWSTGKGIGRLKSTGTSFSYTFNNDTFAKLFGRGRERQGSEPPDNAPESLDSLGGPDGLNSDIDPQIESQEPGSGRRLRNDTADSSGEFDADGYYINSIPWTFSVNYSLNINYDNSKFDEHKMEYKYKYTHALSFNGSIQPTKNWRVNFNATYDFENKKISYMTCNLTRNMHCFQMTASVMPIGNYKSYSFSMAVSSQLLKDLKYDKHSNYRDGQTWY